MAVLGTARIGCKLRVQEFGWKKALGRDGADLILAEVLEKRVVSVFLDVVIEPGPGSGILELDGTITAGGQHGSFFFIFGNRRLPACGESLVRFKRGSDWRF